MQLSIASALSLVVPFVWGPSPLNLQPSLEYPVSLYPFCPPCSPQQSSGPDWAHKGTQYYGSSG